MTYTLIVLSRKVRKGIPHNLPSYLIYHPHNPALLSLTNSTTAFFTFSKSACTTQTLPTTTPNHNQTHSITYPYKVWVNKCVTRNKCF